VEMNKKYKLLMIFLIITLIFSSIFSIYIIYSHIESLNASYIRIYSFVGLYLIFYSIFIMFASVFAIIYFFNQQQNKSLEITTKNLRYILVFIGYWLSFVVIIIYSVFFVSFSEPPCIHNINLEDNITGQVVELNVTGFDQHGDVYPELHSTSNYKIFLNYENINGELLLNESNFYNWDNSTWFSYEDVNNNQIVDENDKFILSTVPGETIEMEIFYIPYGSIFNSYSWSPAIP